MPEEPKTSRTHYFLLTCYASKEQARDGFKKLSPGDFRGVSNDIVSEASPNKRFEKGERDLQHGCWDCISPSWIETQLLLLVKHGKALNSHRDLWNTINHKYNDSKKEATHVRIPMNNVHAHPCSYKHSHSDDCRQNKLHSKEKGSLELRQKERDMSKEETKNK